MADGDAVLPTSKKRLTPFFLSFFLLEWHESFPFSLPNGRFTIKKAASFGMSQLFKIPLSVLVEFYFILIPNSKTLLSHFCLRVSVEFFIGAI